jgi:uncharacterized protein YndB with AHSA1/START domain
MIRPFAAVLALVTFAAPAGAEVMATSDTSFQIKSEVATAAAPDAVYAAFAKVEQWWDGRHTYSAQAASMSLTLEPGGCFCETLPGGGVRHGVVMLAWPGRMIVLDAALGPLQQTGASGALTFQFRAEGDGTRIIQTYNVGGLAPGMAASWAPAVDRVQTIQLERLARFAATGAPD